MRKNHKIIWVVLAVGAAFALGLGWHWVQGTPYFSLYQIGAVLKNRDIKGFLTYVDLEAILSRQAPESLSNLLKSIPSSNPISQWLAPLGEIKIRLSPETNQGLSRLAIQTLREYLENPENPTLPSSFGLLFIAQVKAKGDYALVTLKMDRDQLRMGLRKNAGIWRVVELNPEDTQRFIKTYLLPSKS